MFIWGFQQECIVATWNSARYLGRLQDSSHTHLILNFNPSKHDTYPLASTTTMNKSSTRPLAPHEVLGVQRYATARQVKIAYRKLSLQLHPDKNPHKREWATAKFKELNEAYETMVCVLLAGFASPLLPTRPHRWRCEEQDEARL
jgi:DnaJ-domain-containing protein 1